jgi:hypothetical protein
MALSVAPRLGGSSILAFLRLFGKSAKGSLPP